VSDQRLAVFLKLNTKGKKAPWQERVKVVDEVFPSYARLDWLKAFNGDIELFARVLRDILKTDQTQPGRSGPRPNLDRDPALAKLREYMGDDYSDLLFPDALKILTLGRSLRSVAQKTGIARTTLTRHIEGERPIDMVTLERIARAYKKDPGYFLEYRVAYVLAALGDRMVVSPETTVGLYRRIKGEK